MPSSGVGVSIEVPDRFREAPELADRNERAA